MNGKSRYNPLTPRFICAPTSNQSVYAVAVPGREEQIEESSAATQWDKVVAQQISSLDFSGVFAYYTAEWGHRIRRFDLDSLLPQTMDE